MKTRARSANNKGEAVLEVYLGSEGYLHYLLTLPGKPPRGQGRLHPDLERQLRQFDTEIALAEAEAAVLRDGRSRQRVMALAEIMAGILPPEARQPETAPRWRIVPAGAAGRIPFRLLMTLNSSSIRCSSDLTMSIQPRPVRLKAAPAALTAKPVVIMGNVKHLPDAAAEAEAVRRLTGARIESGARLGRAGFLRRYQSCGLCYFIGHALSRPHNPALSCLELGGGQRLFAADLLAARPARHRPRVVLSACSTASSGGSLGLAHAFLLTGASEVLACRWRVSDAHAISQAAGLIRGELPEITPGHPWLWAGWEKWVK